MENQDVLLFFRVSSGQLLKRPVTLSSYTQNLPPSREGLGMVLGHTALQESRSSQEKAGASVLKDDLCIALRAKA